MSEVKLRLLSELFYERNAADQEILSKHNRPYLVLIVLYRGLTFAIPFRSNIHHAHAYKFQDENSKRTSSGLDFSKSVIARNEDEIGDAAHIDAAERKELLKCYDFIVEKFQHYIDDFIAGLEKKPLPAKYKFSALTYYKGVLLQSLK